MKLVLKKIDVQAAAAITAKHIEIVRSTKPWLSSMSQVSCDAILAVLSTQYTKVGVTVVNNLHDLQALVELKPDLVFLGMKFIPLDLLVDSRDSKKVWLSQYLDEYGIAYTGSNQKASELELNKQSAKQRLLDTGLQTSPFYVVKKNQPLKIGDIRLAYPLFIKPSDRGGGMGVDSDSVVLNFEQLLSKVNSITANIHSDSLIERYLPGREISAAILKDEHSPEFSVMLIERIVPPNEQGVSILSPQVKHADAGLSVAVTDTEVKNKVTLLAIRAFHALGARDYARIDIRLDESGEPNFLEANLLPSLIEDYGNFPKACQLNIGLGYEAMIHRIVKLGLVRQPELDNDLEIIKETNALVLEAVV